MKLYEINESIIKALETEQIDEETGEVIYSPNLDELQEQFDEKVDSIACYIKQLQYETDNLKSEELVLKQRREQKEKRIEWLKNYLTSNLLENGKDKFESTRNVITFRKSESVNILNEELLPKEYLTEKITYSPDKKAIKEAISKGNEISGAEVISKKNIQIK